MNGVYFAYQGNVYKIVGFDSWQEVVRVDLVQKLQHKLAEDSFHERDLEYGRMWVSEFFKFASIIPEGKLLYEKT